MLYKLDKKQVEEEKVINCLLLNSKPIFFHFMSLIREESGNDKRLKRNKNEINCSG